MVMSLPWNFTKRGSSSLRGAGPVYFPAEQRRAVICQSTQLLHVDERIQLHLPAGGSMDLPLLLNPTAAFQSSWKESSFCEGSSLVSPIGCTVTVHPPDASFVFPISKEV